MQDVSCEPLMLCPSENPQASLDIFRQEAVPIGLSWASCFCVSSMKPRFLFFWTVCAGFFGLMGCELQWRCMSNRLFRERMLVKLVGCLFSFLIWFGRSGKAFSWSRLRAVLKHFRDVFWVIWSVCGWLWGQLGEMAELVGNVQKIGLE